MDTNLLQTVWENKQKQAPPTEEELRAQRVEQQSSYGRKLVEANNLQDELNENAEKSIRETVSKKRQQTYEKMDSVWQADNSLVNYCRDLDRKMEERTVNFNKFVSFLLSLFLLCCFFVSSLFVSFFLSFFFFFLSFFLAFFLGEEVRL